MSKLTLAELEAFITVVDTGSMTRAAQVLDQPVSSVSRLLGRLEEKLQTTLLRRTTRRLDLTDEGCVFVEQTRAILAALQQAEQSVTQRLGHPSGPLRVDAATPFILHRLAPLVGRYRQRYPRVVLELSSNEGYVDLLERRIDLAIRFGPLKDSSLHSRLLFHSRQRIVASPGYLASRGRPTSIRDLAAHELLGFSEPDSLNHWPLRNGDNRQFHIRPTLYACSGEVLRQLAVHDQGLACLSEFSCDADIASGNLVEVLADHHSGATQPVNAVYYRNTAVSARVASFIDFLSEQLGS